MRMGEIEMKESSPSDIVTLTMLSVDDDLIILGEASSTAISTLPGLLLEKNLLPTRLGFRLKFSWAASLKGAIVRSNSCDTSSIQNCTLSKRGFERFRTIDGISTSVTTVAERLLFCPDGRGGFCDSLIKPSRLEGGASPWKRM